MGKRGPSKGRGGRPKTPLAEKLLNGNPSKKPIKVLDFGNISDLEGEQIPKPREYMLAKQKQGEIIAAQIREELWKWLKERNCEKLLPMLLLDQYPMSYARWIQAEQAISEYGSLGRHVTTGNAQQSPFVMIAQNANKQALNIWGQIYEVVKENCSSDYRPFSASDDIMERLLTSKR